jgi:UDP-N-acetyl-D-mannosaminuronate dehydrogenase
MPKGIDPKAYAARVTKAKKVVAAASPEVKAKLKEMYPKVTKESIANKALSPKKSTPAIAKPTTGIRATAKAVEKVKAKAKPIITKAEKQIAKELSTKGMKQAAKNQSDAMDKKYPGLYKKTGK